RADAAPSDPLRPETVRRRNRAESISEQSRTSYQISQRRAHLLSSAEQTILGCVLGRSENFADVAKPQAVVMPELENHALPRSQLLQTFFDSLLKLPVPELAFGIGLGGSFLETLHTVHRPFAGLNHGGFLLADAALAKVVEAYVGHDPIQPGVEAAIEAERVQ